MRTPWFVFPLLAACGSDTVPTLADAALTTDEDTAVVLTLDGADADGDPITYAVGAPPTLGTAVITGNQLTYTPDPDVFGADVFTVVPTAAGADGALSTVSVAVAPVNDAPTLASLTATVAEHETLTVPLVAHDVDGDLLTYSLVDAAALGTLTVDAAGVLTYTPTDGAVGDDVVGVRVSDGALTADATVTVTVTAVNDPPVAVGAAISVVEDSQTSGALEATDPDGDPLTFALATPPAGGDVQLTASTGVFTYTPRQDVTGDDAFTFTVTDGTSTSAPATVQVTITPVDDPPEPAAATLVLVEDTVGTVTLSAEDVDSPVLTWSVLTQGDRGHAALTGDVLTYTPTLNESGVDTVYLQVADALTAVPVTLHVTITPANDAPVASPGALTVAEDAGPTSHTLTGDDVDGDALSFAVDGAAFDGTVTVDPLTGVATLTTASDFWGTTAFTYTVTDGVLTSAPATVTVTVTPAPDPPVAAPDTYSIQGGVTVHVPAAEGLLANDVDPDGDVLTATPAVTQTTRGERVEVFADGAFDLSVALAPGFTDTFTYTVVDTTGRATVGTATISVDGRVWFVAAHGGGLGTQDSPLADLDLAIRRASSGDTLYLPYNFGLAPSSLARVIVSKTLRLIGEGVALTVSGFDALPAGNPTVLPVGLGLTDGVEVAGLAFIGVPGTAITGVDVTDVSVHDVYIGGLPATAINASGGARWTIERLTVETGAMCLLAMNVQDLWVDGVQCTDVDEGVSLSYLSTPGASATVRGVVVDAITQPTRHGVVVTLRAVAQGMVSVEDLVVNGADTGVLVNLAGAPQGAGSGAGLILNAPVLTGTGTGVDVVSYGTSRGTVQVTNGVIDGAGVMDDGVVASAREASDTTVLLTNTQIDNMLGDGVAATAVSPAVLRVGVRDSRVRTATTTSPTGAGISATANGGEIALDLDASTIGHASFSKGVRLEARSGGLLGARIVDTDSYDVFSMMRTVDAILELGDGPPVGTADISTDGGALARAGNTSNGMAPRVSVTGQLTLVNPADLTPVVWP